MTDKTALIAELNDRVRHGLDRTARIVMTATCLAELARDDRQVSEALAQAEALAAIRHYAFKPTDGAERASGDFLVAGKAVRFTIDYYDLALEWGSENPADPAVTTRVMTIMLPSDD
ncbi:MAG TPA: DUF3768 domain-containing protein [Sphingobium sp.]|uniref:DUF3768 domain-containing protein n=1 Tax=Sphingobium sp. TaxID=1912891 RepID=UPI002ED1F607